MNNGEERGRRELLRIIYHSRNDAQPIVHIFIYYIFYKSMYIHTVELTIFMYYSI